jgi:hypothetical protein
LIEFVAGPAAERDRVGELEALDVAPVDAFEGRKALPSYVRWFISQFCGSLSALMSRPGVTSAPTAGNADTVKAPASNRLRKELGRWVIIAIPPSST